MHFKKRTAALAVASCLALAPGFAAAAGLGKLTVLSGLGQPLRAELDLGATKEELAGMSARLAPQEIFKQAGVEFAPVLQGLRFALEQRPSGQTVVKVSSSRPINEPFLDFLVELNWPTGRLVREYTFLLDPPEGGARGSAQASVEARLVEAVPGGAAPEVRAAPGRPSAQRNAPAPRPVEEGEKGEKGDKGEKAEKGTAGERVVKPGETMRLIANETRYEGVSLEQMLIGLYRNNPTAFIEKDVNRVKSGAILNLPDPSAVAAIDPGEARKLLLNGVGDWSVYRQRLAAKAAQGSAREGGASQASAGRITARVEDKPLPEEKSRDQVRVSRTEPSGRSAAQGAESEADRIARDRAMKEAQERVGALEKNVQELQKLLEMKNDKLAQLQQQLAHKEASKPEPVKPAEMPKPAEAPKAAEAPKPVEPPAPAQPPKAEAEKPVEPPKPMEPPKPEEAPAAPAEAPKPPPKPAAAPKPPPKPVLPPPPPPEPDFVEQLLEDPVPLAGGGGIIALLLGYLFVRRRQSQKAAAPATTTAAATGDSAAGSVFGVTGGQSIDTGNTPPQTGDFSQTGPGTIDTDEVDPVAEADVYMAYGRDTQAEEILLEALLKDPGRTAIHVKLLEIYAQRRSVKQFNTLAGDFHAQTGGVGAEWDKVAALGAGLDPTNPLYSGAAAPAPAAAPAGFDAEATMIVSPQNLSPTPVLPPETPAPVAAAIDTSAMPADLAVAAPASDSALGDFDLSAEVDPMSLDFDLGTPEPAAAVAAVEPEPEPPADAGGLDFDFDLAPQEETPATPADSALSADTALDLSFDPDLLGAPAEPVAASTGESPAASFEPAPAALDFPLEDTLSLPEAPDLALDPLPVAEDLTLDPDQAPAAAPMESALSDLDFDMDFDMPQPSAAEPEVPELPAAPEIPETPSAASPFADISLDLDFPASGETPALGGEALDLPAVEPVAEAGSDSALGEFDIDFGDLPAPAQDFDLGAIDLDLAAGAPDSPAEPAAPEPEPAGVTLTQEQWEEVNTKLDLARAYEEMGDLEGARELLQEVMAEGSVDLVDQAHDIFRRIGS